MLPELYGEIDPDYCPSWTRLEFPEGIQPKTYLEFANTDVKSTDEPRCFVNALSNAKRALHFQIEILTDAFGISYTVKNTKYISFPERLKFCSKCGIVSPRILAKLNKVRNEVEHDYYLPSRDEVEDYIDIVELFLAATDRFFYQFPNDVEFLCKSIDESAPDISYLDFLPSEGKIRLRMELIEIDGIHEWESVDIESPSEEFFKWLRYIVEKSK